MELTATIEYRTIEFRKGGAVKTAQESLQWAEFAMTFVVSAMETERMQDYLNRTAPNVYGLKTFLGQPKQRPELFRREYLEPLFAGKNGRDHLQPVQACQTWVPEELPPRLSPQLRRLRNAEELRYFSRIKEADRSSVAGRLSTAESDLRIDGVAPYSDFNPVFCFQQRENSPTSCRACKI